MLSPRNAFHIPLVGKSAGTSRARAEVGVGVEGEGTVSRGGSTWGTWRAPRRGPGLPPSAAGALSISSRTGRPPCALGPDYNPTPRPPRHYAPDETFTLRCAPPPTPTPRPHHIVRFKVKQLTARRCSVQRWAPPRPPRPAPPRAGRSIRAAAVGGQSINRLCGLYWSGTPGCSGQARGQATVRSPRPR